MQAIPIVVAPTHSKETRLLSTAAVHLYRYLRANGWHPHILVGIGARRLPMLAKLNAIKGGRIAMFYYGHGTKNSLIGSEIISRRRSPMRLITKRSDPVNRAIVRRLEGGLLYTIACDSADDLGVHLVNSGVDSFVGSTQPMWIVQNLDFDADDVPDMTELLTLGPRHLAEGASLDQAVEDYKCRALEMGHNYTFNSEYPELADIMVPNIEHYKVIGNKGWMMDGEN